MRRLCVVEDVFELRGRGVIVTPGLTPCDHAVRIGAAVALMRPDGTTAETTILGVDMGGTARRASRALLLGPDLTRQDAPIGTEVWLRA